MTDIAVGFSSFLAVLFKPMLPSQHELVKAPLTPAPSLMPFAAHTCVPGRRENLLRRKVQIEAQIASIDARQRLAHRKRETRANIVIGAIMRAHAGLNPGFADQMAAILDDVVSRPADRVLLASVLGLPRLARARLLPDGRPLQPTTPLPAPQSVTITARPDRPRLRHLAAELVNRR